MSARRPRPLLGAFLTAMLLLGAAPAAGAAPSLLVRLMPAAGDLATRLGMDRLTAREIEERAEGYGPLESTFWPADYSSPESELPRFVEVTLLLEQVNAHLQDLQSRRRLLFAYHRLAIFLYPLLDMDAADERAEALRVLAGGDAENPVVRGFRDYAMGFSKSRWAGPRLLERLVNEAIVPLSKRILQDSPGAMPIRYVLGEALYMAGQAEEAVRELQDNIHMDKSGRLLVILGKALYKAGKADVARSYFEMARYLDPKLSGEIGIFTERMDARNDMVRFSRELVKNPKDTESRIGLAKAYAQRGRIEDALETLQPCVREAPDKTEALQLLLELGLDAKDPGPIVDFVGGLPPETKGLQTQEVRTLLYSLVVRHLAISIDEGRTGVFDAWDPKLRELARALFGRSFARRDEDHVLRAVFEVLARERELSDLALRDGRWRRSPAAKAVAKARRQLRDQLGRYVVHLETRPEPAQVLQAVLLGSEEKPDLRASMKTLRQNADSDPWARLNYAHLLILQGLVRKDFKRVEEAQWQLGQLKIDAVMPEWLLVFSRAQAHLAYWAATEGAAADELEKAGGAFAKLLLWRAKLKIPETVVRLVRINLAACHAAKQDWLSITRTLDEEKILDIPVRALRMRTAKLLARALAELGRADEAEAIRRKAGAPGKEDRPADGFILRTRRMAVHRPLPPGVDPVTRILQGNLGNAPDPLEKTEFWANLVPELAVDKPGRGRNPYLHAQFRLVLAIFPREGVVAAPAPAEDPPAMLRRPETEKAAETVAPPEEEKASPPPAKPSLQERIEALRRRVKG